MMVNNANTRNDNQGYGTIVVGQTVSSSASVLDSHRQDQAGDVVDEEKECVVVPPLKAVSSSRRRRKVIISSTVATLAFVFVVTLSFIFQARQNNGRRQPPVPPMEVDTAKIVKMDSTKHHHPTTTTDTSTTKPSKSKSFPIMEYPKWPELPWTLVKSTSGNEEEDHYIGYLQVCDTGTKEFAYRVGAAPPRSNTNNSTSVVPPPCIPQDGPSPLIRMRPRTNYKLLLMNYNTNTELDIPTNVHTHGLHISGVGKVDDITRSVDNYGNCLLYEYYIPHVSDVGTFWYHSHRHPLTSQQVSHGAYGLLIVDETEEQLSTYPQHLQNFLTKKEILFQYGSILDKSNSDINIPRTNIINGYVNTTLHMTWNVNEWYYVRTSFVVISDPISYIEFVNSRNVDSCEVRVVAYDGVYRSKVPHEKSSYKHMLSASSRLDLAVKCSKPNTVVSIYFHQGNLTKEAKMVVIDIVDQKEEEEERIVASPYWDMEQQTQWSPQRPYYMPNLLDSQTHIDEIWNVSMERGVLTSNSLSINHQQWDPRIPFKTIPLMSVVEWNLYNTQSHPFHVHINRMQIANKNCGYRYEVGEYYDTIAADETKATNKKKPCKVRMQFWDFAGRVIIHCHKLKHEDKGMMTWIHVTDGPGDNVAGFPEQSCTSPFE